jgi:hypothetical protein
MESLGDPRYWTTIDRMRALGECSCNRIPGHHKFDSRLCYPDSRFQSEVPSGGAR